MDRNEILNAAQEDASEIGEYETHISNKALLYGLIVGIVFLLCMICVEWFIFKKIDFGKPSLLFSIAGSINLYEGKVGKSKKSLVGGIVLTLLCLVTLILYIGALFI